MGQCLQCWVNNDPMVGLVPKIAGLIPWTILLAPGASGSGVPTRDMNFWWQFSLKVGGSMH